MFSAGHEPTQGSAVGEGHESTQGSAFGEGHEQFPALMPALYSGSKATDPRSYASFDALWRAFCD